MKYACVTGAERGLGFALTKELLAAGYTVFAGRYLTDWPGLDELAQEAGERLVIFPLDVRDDESVRAAAMTIAARTDKLDRLINNAAVLGRKDLTGDILGELDFDEMLNTINVCALGSLRMAHALMPLIINSEEKLLINIASEAGSIGQSWRTNMFGYCMAKAAVNMHSTIIYNKVKELGVKVLNLHPGWVKSWLEGSRFLDEAHLTPEESAAKLMRVIADHAELQEEQPIFVDVDGKRQLW